MSNQNPNELVYVQHGPSKYSQSAMTIKGKAQWTGVGDDLYFNPHYFCTNPGVLKLLQLLFGIIAMSCISPPLTWFARLFTFVLAISFAITLILCFAYLVTLKNVFFPKFDWQMAELIFTIAASLSLLITALIHISYSSRDDYRYSLTYFNSYLGTSYYGTYITAGVFGILNSIVYAIGAYYLSRERKHRNIGGGGSNTVAPSDA